MLTIRSGLPDQIPYQSGPTIRIPVAAAESRFATAGQMPKDRSAEKSREDGDVEVGLEAGLETGVCVRVRCVVSVGNQIVHAEFSWLHSKYKHGLSRVGRRLSRHACDAGVLASNADTAIDE